MPPTQQPPPMRRAAAGVVATLRGSTGIHADLRSRLVGVAAISVVADLVAAGLALAFEQGHGAIGGYGDALFWTTTQMLTVSSQVTNPVTTAGKVLDVGLELYAVTVVTSLAGVFGAFFHHRTQQRMADTG